MGWLGEISDLLFSMITGRPVLWLDTMKSVLEIWLGWYILAMLYIFAWTECRNSGRPKACVLRDVPLGMLDPLLALWRVLDGLMLTIKVTDWVMPPECCDIYLEGKFHAGWWSGHLKWQKKEISSSLQKR